MLRTLDSLMRSRVEDSRFGGVFDDVFDEIGDVLSSIQNNEIGSIVLRATAIAASAGVAPLVGSVLTGVTTSLPIAAGALTPIQIATISNTCGFIAYQIGMAAPGMLTGQDFITAYAREAKWRLTFLLQYFTGEKGNELGKWIESGTLGATKELTSSVQAVVGPTIWAEVERLKKQAVEYASRRFSPQSYGDTIELNRTGIELAQGEKSWIQTLRNKDINWLTSTPDDLAIALSLSRVDCALEARAVATGMTQYLDEWIAYMHSPDFDMETGRRRGQGSKLNDDYVQPSPYVDMDMQVMTSYGPGPSQFIQARDPDMQFSLAPFDPSTVESMKDRKAKGEVSGSKAIPVAIGGGLGVAAALALGLSAPIAVPLALLGGGIAWALSRD